MILDKHLTSVIMIFLSVVIFPKLTSDWFTRFNSGYAIYTRPKEDKNNKLQSVHVLVRNNWNADPITIQSSSKMENINVSLHAEGEKLFNPDQDKDFSIFEHQLDAMKSKGSITLPFPNKSSAIIECEANSSDILIACKNSSLPVLCINTWAEKIIDYFWCAILTAGIVQVVVTARKYNQTLE